MSDDDWRDRAACLGMDTSLWYPEVGHPIPEVAQETCRWCPVLEPCKEEGIVNSERGVWGLTTQRQRADIRRERNMDATNEE